MNKGWLKKQALLHTPVSEVEPPAACEGERAVPVHDRAPLPRLPGGEGQLPLRQMEPCTECSLLLIPSDSGGAILWKAVWSVRGMLEGRDIGRQRGKERR